MTRPLHIITAADERYAPHLAAMLHSLLDATPGTAITVHFLHRPGFDPATLARLQALCGRHGATLADVTVPRERIAPLVAESRYTEEAWYRLLLPSLLAQLDRALWLDADLLVRQSIVPLWNTDLRGRSVAAVLNALAPLHRNHPQALGMPAAPWRYFNTGVMVLDLARMRATDAESRLSEAARRLRGRIVFAEQDVFNPVFSDDITSLPLAWNVTAGSYLYAGQGIRLHGLREYRAAIARPGIVHFTLHKPWLYGSSHPWRDEYLHHRAAAGWPAPEYPDRTWRNALARRLPMSLRLLLRDPRLLGLEDVAAMPVVWTAGLGG
jgi:lipopolysaccharide biosynthesis glycosyltransferase